MIEKQFPLAEGAHLTLRKMMGDLKVSGWNDEYVQVRLNTGDEADLLVNDSPAGLELSARASCDVWVPADVPLTIQQVMGNMKARDLRAPLKAEQVHGDLRLSNLGEVVVDMARGNLKADTLESLRVVAVAGDVSVRVMHAVDLQEIQGNLRAKALDSLRVSNIAGELLIKDVEGPVNAGPVSGNAVLKDVGGMVAIDQIAGNLVAKDLLGGARVGRINGNLVLGGDLGSGCTYQFRADGNGVLKLAPDTNAHLMLKAEGVIRSSVTLTEAERTARTLSGTLGDGGTEVAVEAGGNIVLNGGRPVTVAWDEDEPEVGSCEEDEFEACGASLGEEISRQVEESLRSIDMEAIGRQASAEIERAMAQLRVKLETVNWEQMGQHAQRAIERALAGMQRDLDRMGEKAARQQERAERMAERQKGHAARFRAVTWQPGQRPEAAGPAGPRPSFDQERMSILKMVEEGQVTPDEAALLLDALK